MLTTLRLSLILMCLTWQLFSFTLSSQSISYIAGKIMNSTSSDPVAFAAIQLKNNRMGVFANAEGDFKIIRSPEFLSDTVIITCIGYKRHTVSFRDLKAGTVNRIYLTPAIYGLAEVKVTASRKKLSSVTIIRRAIRNIKTNYPENPFSFISYYRDYQKTEGNYINLNEGIVQTLDNGFSSESVLNSYRLLDFKKNTDFPRINLSPYYDTVEAPLYNNSNKTIPNARLGDQYGNELFILMVHDAVRNFDTRSFSFVDIFSRDFITNHSFAEPAPVYNNNLLLYKIIFSARPRITDNSLSVSGAIYIQPKDYSIHKLEYSCYYLQKATEMKEMFNVDIEYGYENSMDSLMHLKYISFNNIFNVPDSADNTGFRILNSYWDPADFGRPTIVFEFNGMIDPESTGKKENYTILSGDRALRIKEVEIRQNLLYVRLREGELKGSGRDCKVRVQNIRDLNGNILNEQKMIELYQYRELFVQDYNNSSVFKDNCYMHYMPLEQNCISRFPGKEKYWMNTPELIKRDR